MNLLHCPQWPLLRNSGNQFLGIPALAVFATWFMQFWQPSPANAQMSFGALTLKGQLMESQRQHNHSPPTLAAMKLVAMPKVATLNCSADLCPFRDSDKHAAATPLWPN